MAAAKKLSKHVSSGGRKENNEDRNNPYDYIELSEIGTDGERVNIYGVVKWFKYENGRRSLYLCIIDPSLTVGNHVVCKLRTEDASCKLPDVHRVGDIIRLHRVAVQKNANIVSLYGLMGVCGLHCLVFDGRLGQCENARMSTSANYTYANSDRTCIRFLRNWIMNQKHVDSVFDVNVASELPADTVSLSQFISATYKSIFVQAIGVRKFDGDALIMRVWDGTMPAKPAENNLFHDGWMSYCMGLDRIAGELAVDVFVYEEHKAAAMTVQPGDLVSIQNVHFTPSKIYNGMFKFVVHGGSKAYRRGIVPFAKNSESARRLRGRLEQYAAHQPGAPQQQSAQEGHADHQQQAGAEENVKYVKVQTQDRQLLVPIVFDADSDEGTDSSDGEPFAVVRSVIPKKMVDKGV